MHVFSPRNKDVFASLLPKRFPSGIGKMSTSFRFCEIKHPGSCFVSFNFFWACIPSSTRSSSWESVFLYQIPGTEAKGPFFSPPYNPLPPPSTPTTAELLLMLPLVPMSTRPLFTGKLRAFAKNCCCTIWQSVNFLVVWMLVRKQNFGRPDLNHL